MANIEDRVFSDWKEHCPWRDPNYEECRAVDNFKCEKDNCAPVHFIGAYHFEKDCE